MQEFAAEHELARLDDAALFEHFCSHLTISRFVPETFDTADVVVGSGADTGIDAIAILVNGALMTDADHVTEMAGLNGYVEATFVFMQADRGSEFKANKIGNFGYGVQDFFAEEPKLPRNAEVIRAAGIMTRVFSYGARFRKKPACKLYFVTTGTWTGDRALEARRASVIDDLVATRLFREIDLIPVGSDEIQQLYRDSKNAISREFEFSLKTLVPAVPGVTEAYIGLLPAREFVGLIEESGEILKGIFYDNVRDWQGYNEVNAEMKDSLSAPEARSRFGLMNNGVTIIAKSLQTIGNRMHIEDYQIVNGCQTSHVLFDQRETLDGSVFVPLRLIATRDEDVIASIIKATNRQTEVRTEQLLALSDFQKRLEAFFNTYGNGKRLYYERRSRQYNNIEGIEKTRIVTPRNLIRAYASMFMDEPHRATRSYGAILEQVGRGIFADTDRLEPYYAAAFALYRLEFLFRNQSISSDFKPARFQLLMAARIIAAGPDLPSSNSRNMERLSNALCEILWDPRKSETLFAHAGAVLLGIGADLQSDALRTQPFTEELHEACSESWEDNGPLFKS
ncbi:MAG TPA: AIPR family protein [Gammaproteobacteria bacterium]|nr:AIPR family protein [Gammaproteobacteria bacterium]